MSPKTAAILPDQAFAQLPPKLREDLISAFEKIVRNFAEGRWEPAELNGGKLCEAVYTICKGVADGSMPSRATKPSNMVKACRELEEAPKAAAPHSVRVQIPRILLGLYDIRNNRNVGHVGGDVDPNHMDAMFVLQNAKWIVAEVVRVLHKMPVEDAVALIDSLVEREVPLVWKVGDKRRVLDPKMSIKDKTLLLLHGSNTPVAEDVVCDWVEQPDLAVYRRDILRPAHKAKLVEYDPDSKTVVISPNGVAYVEEKLIPHSRIGS
jgi:hypothetical protein